jgi:tRNA dimethylallyltransferase
MNMKTLSGKPPLALIAGPTASGKSALALALSRLMPVTIINADASQVYRDLRILSARPTEAEEAEAPHRLFGTVDGATACSAADWAAMAKLAIAESWQAGRLPVLVGGTGLYIRTLLDGIAPVPEIDPAIRAAVRGLSVREAYGALSAEDAQAAARLSPTDTTRIARALEVIRSTGRAISSWQSEMTGGIGEQVSLHPLILLPPRDWLYARCDARFAAMLEGGARDEVVALLARQLDSKLPVMRAIGVREVSQIIEHPESADVGERAAQQATRNFAKRQYTWFNNQPPARWERNHSQLNDDIVNDLAIKLRDMALTS